MENPLKSPLVRIVVPILLGVILYLQLGRPHLAAYGIVLFMALFWGLRLSPVDISWKYRWAPGVVILCLLCCIGCYWAALRDQPPPEGLSAAKEHYSRGRFLLKVSSEPEKRLNNIRMVTVVEYCPDSALRKAFEGQKCLVYMAPDSMCQVPVIGDVLAARTGLHLISPPSNPGEFDFRKYMARKGVHLRTFLGDNDWAVVGHERMVLAGLASRCRGYVYKRLQESGVNGREFDLAASLLLGQKDGLEKDIRDSFSNAGAMHILCVSGLHVGIIYVILNVLLKGLRRTKKTRFIHGVLVVSCIWAYAFITGMSPSVTRASLMFSVLQSGKLMNNPPPTVNSLAASALVLVLLDPMVVTNIGFQFSFLSVLSIVMFMPVLQDLWMPGNFLLSRAWALILVSLAAQLGAGPLGLHYFHQFPSWFLLTNLVVIPLASVIVYLGITVIILPWATLSGFFGMLLSKCLWFLAFAVQCIDRIPGSVVHSASFSPLNTLVVYILLFSLMTMVAIKSKIPFFLVIVSILLLLASATIERYREQQRKGIYTYALQGAFILDHIDGGVCHSVQGNDSIPLASLDYSVSPNRDRCRINEVKNYSLMGDTAIADGHFHKSRNLILFHGRKIFIADRPFPPSMQKRLEVDVVIVTGGQRFMLEELNMQVSWKELVFHNSVPPWELERYRQECSDLGLEYHSMPSQGCYIKEF